MRLRRLLLCKKHITRQLKQHCEVCKPSCKDTRVCVTCEVCTPLVTTHESGESAVSCQYIHSFVQQFHHKTIRDYNFCNAYKYLPYHSCISNIGGIHLTSRNHYLILLCYLFPTKNILI